MGSFDKYSNKPKNAPFTSVTFGFGKPVWEIELNEMQQIQNEKMTALLGIKGDCVIDRDGFSYDGTTLTVNTKIVKDGIIIDSIGATMELSDGESAYISSEEVDYTYSDTIHANGNTNGDVIDNTIMDTRVNVETTRRKGYKFTLNKEEGMLLGVAVGNKFICLAPDYSGGICEYHGSNFNIKSKKGSLKVNYVYGRSVQSTYAGYNRFNMSVSSVLGSNGVQCLVRNGRALLFGTASDDATFELGSLSISEGETLKLTGCPIGGGENTYRLYFNQQDIYDDGDGAIYSGDVSTSGTSIIIKISKGYTCSFLTFKPMVSSNLDLTCDDFEPYVGCLPSPSPSYPQTIINSYGFSIISSGKNMITTIENSDESCGVTWNVGNDGHIVASGTPTDSSSTTVTLFSCFSDGGTYTISLKGNYSNVELEMLVTDCGDSGEFDKIFCTIIGDTITFDSSKYRDKLIFIMVKNKYTDSDVVCDAYLQVERGDTSTEFEKFSGNRASFPTALCSIPVSSHGNVSSNGVNYISDYLDVQNRKIIHNVDKFMASEKEWVKDDSLSGDDYASYKCDLSLVEAKFYNDCATVISDTYTPKSVSECNESTRNTIVVTDDGKSIEVIGVEQLTLDDWNSFVSGTGFNVQYVLNEEVPEDIDLSTSEAYDAFLTLFALKSKYPETNVFTNGMYFASSIVDFDMSDTEVGALLLDGYDNSSYSALLSDRTEHVMRSTSKNVFTNMFNPSEETSTSCGITCTANGDGTYTFSGTATTGVRFTLGSINGVQSKYLRITGNYKDSGCTLKIHDAISESSGTVYEDDGDGFMTTFKNDLLILDVWVDRGVTLEDVVIKPMVIDANMYQYSTYDDYVKYAVGNCSLNKDVAEIANSISALSKRTQVVVSSTEPTDKTVVWVQ